MQTRRLSIQTVHGPEVTSPGVRPLAPPRASVQANRLYAPPRHWQIAPRALRNGGLAGLCRSRIYSKRSEPARLSVARVATWEKTWAHGIAPNG